MFFFEFFTKSDCLFTTRCVCRSVSLSAQYTSSARLVPSSIQHNNNNNNYIMYSYCGTHGRGRLEITKTNERFACCVLRRIRRGDDTNTTYILCKPPRTRVVTVVMLLYLSFVRITAESGAPSVRPARRALRGNGRGLINRKPFVGLHVVVVIVIILIPFETRDLPCPNGYYSSRRFSTFLRPTAIVHTF